MKLIALGILNHIVNWIISFLPDCSQICIKLNKSNPENFNMNIIQGSSLDPTHYIIMEGGLKPISSINTIIR